MELLFSMLSILRRIFPAVLRMSMTAGVLVLAALALRLVFRKAPKWVLCLVWIPVAVRLCCPMLPQAGVSLMPRPERFAAAVPGRLPEALRRHGGAETGPSGGSGGNRGGECHGASPEGKGTGRNVPEFPSSG